MFVNGGGISNSYKISNSLRFRASGSTYLSRSPSVAVNRKTWTWSGWVKRGTLGAASTEILGYYQGNLNSQLDFVFDANGTISVVDYNGSYAVQLISSSVYRDPSAWYHFILVYDTTNVTASERIRIFVNGSRLTTFSTATYPAQNYDSQAWQTSTPMTIGSKGSLGYFDGYFAEVNFVDGQALDPSNFGQQDSNGVWVPKKYTGTYGTNGFYLPFNDGTSGLTSICADKSGNGNNWTSTNHSTTAGVDYDWMIDTPSNNFAVMNQLRYYGAAPTKASLYMTSSPNIDSDATFLMTTGKWYWEVQYTSGGGGVYPICGIHNPDVAPTLYNGYDVNGWGIAYSGSIYYNATNPQTYTAFSAGDTACFAYDADTGKFYVGKNGTWFNSGNPVAGTGYICIPAWYTSGSYPGLSVASGGVFHANFGQYAATTGAAFDSASGGYFRYTPPSGFKALCTKNLPSVSISNPKEHFDIKTRVGTAAAYSVTGLSFAPAFTWIKSRGRAVSHALYDLVRGTTKDIYTDGIAAETTQTQGVTAFNSDGYSGGTLDKINGTTATNSFVDWFWAAGGTPTTDNVAGAGNVPTAGSVKIDGVNLSTALAGTIAATRLSANTKAGFSIVTYVGTGANATIGHGLGVVPKLIITKTRPGNTSWPVYHEKQNASPASGYMYLNGTTQFTSDSTMFNNTAPTSTVFSIGTNSNIQYNGWSNVSYCFAEIPGYSKFGSYVGNGSADGPFVYCGFRPKYILYKRSDAAYGWVMLDTTRTAYNVVGAYLEPHTTASESTYSFLDILSNGVKLRIDGTAGPGTNYSNGTFIFAAFAEHPFGGSNVAPSPAR